MIPHSARNRPAPWAAIRTIQRRWLLPLVAFDWWWQWVAYLLAQWSFLEVLQYLGSFSVLVGVIFWFGEAGDRIQQRHYQAWQVINTAQGKGGSGGRIEALESLNHDRIPLTGVDVSSAFLQGLQLRHARLIRASLNSADLRDSDLAFSDFTWADLHFANLRGSRLENAIFDHANLSDCDLWGSNLAGAHLEQTDLTDTDLRYADLSGIDWQQISSVRGANFTGVRNAPSGFLAWALRNGALQDSPAP